MDNLLKINNLSVSFHIENKVSSAVKNISLDVAKGEALGIVGNQGVVSLLRHFQFLSYYLIQKLFTQLVKFFIKIKIF